MPSVLITGANRGLGLEFARQYAEAGWRVHATCRNRVAAAALNALAEGASGKVTIDDLDVAEHGQIAALAETLGEAPIDVLLNNAGVSQPGHESFGDIDYARWQATLRVNTLGPARMAEAFIEHVARSERKLIVCISSRLGSITASASGGRYIYRSSKAALNAVVANLAADLRSRGVTVVALHPGWVRTDMGGPNAPLGPTESIAAMRSVIDRLTPADTGRFLNYDGSGIPW